MSFAKYNPEDSVISAESVIRPMWSGDRYAFPNTIYRLPSVSEYYLDVFNVSSATTREAQFSIQYGHIAGSGSVRINPSVPGYSPSRLVYGQYRNLVYGNETENFSFDGGSTIARQIYVINISRDRYKQSIQPGTFNLCLTSGSPARTIQLTDDSNTTSLTRFIGENRVFYIISGTNGTPFNNTTAAKTTYYGMMLPDLGIVILDASGSIGRFYVSGASVDSNPTSPVNNHIRLYNSISTSIDDGFDFEANSQETVSSRFFFTRIKNSEFNYTTNPSIIDENGNLLYTSLIDNPQTFITTVGMYNDNNELLAVAKLSKPLVKDFTKEALVRIKLDY